MSMSPALDVKAETRPGGAPVAAAEAGRIDLFAHPMLPVFTGIAVAVLVTAAVGYARTSGLIVGLWAAGGVAVAVWLRTSRGQRHDLALGAVLAVSILVGEIVAGNPPGLSILFTTTNMLEIVGAVLLARRFAPTLNVASLSGIVRFLACAAVAPLPAAVLSAGAVTMIYGGDVTEAAQTWWFGHALGIALIGCLGLSLTRTTVMRFMRPARAMEALALLGALFLIYCLAFIVRLPIGVFIAPMLFAIAVRLGVAGMSFSLLMVAVLAIGSAMQGFGPYVQGLDASEQVLRAQMLVLVGFMPVLIVAALLEERDRLAERARLGQMRAEKASEAKSRLLANVAHEIKSPVAGVIGIGELWAKGQLGPVTSQQTEMADMLVKTARQVEALAHDLLDVARAESGAVKVELRPTDVPGLLEDVRRSAVLRPEARTVAIELVCEGDGLIAIADSQRLMQVVSNLVTNALKYGGSGGRVVMRALRVDDSVRIEITDFGPGLTPQKQAQLFEPFNRLGLERSTIEGHGVGLALAKRLVELQGGSIGVTSAPDEGATFWVTLPKA